MSDQPNKKITAEAWADIVIEKWQKEIDRLKIKSTGDLYNSFERVVTSNGGGLERIEFEYLFYGWFVNMGVGRGQNAGDVSENNDTAKLLGSRARKPKKWIYKTLGKQTIALAEIMAKKYGDEGQSAIVNFIPGKVNLS
jgi:hypothetical protein